MLARCRVKDRHQALSCPHQRWSVLAHYQLIHHQQLSSHWSRHPAAESSHSQEEKLNPIAKMPHPQLSLLGVKRYRQWRKIRLPKNLSRLSRLERDATMRDVRCTSYVQKGGPLYHARSSFWLVYQLPKKEVYVGCMALTRQAHHVQ